jgi:hypothetical protein
MNAIGYTELTARELPDELQFQVDRENGWFLLVAMLTLPVGLLIFSQTFAAPALRIVLALLSVGWLVWSGFFVSRNWGRVDTTTLSVTGQLFIARGAGLEWFQSGSATVQVPASEVTSFGYQTGGEDDPNGLYVSCGFWKNKCLLPGLSRAQVTNIAVAVVRRFPELAAKMK